MMKSGTIILKTLRRIVAACSLAAMVALFVFPAAACRLGWLARAQLVPAALACSALALALLAVSVALFGRLYCSVVCPLGIAQDVVGDTLGRLMPRRAAKPLSRITIAVRLVVLAFFVVGAFLGFTAILEPYGIFGRFVSVGVLRSGEPSTAAIAWALGLFGLIVALAAFRARWWCNRICPVGTLLGLFSRFAVFRVRIDAAKCVGCGLCVKACDKGAIAPDGKGKVVVDCSSCVSCCDCAGVCPKGALRNA